MDRQTSGTGTDAAPEPGSGGLYTITQSSLRVRDLPVSQMPREELDRLGVEHAPDTVLLAILLRGGVKGLNVLDLAQSLLRAYPTWTAMGEASVEELLGRKFRGLGPVKAQVLAAVLEIARRYNKETPLPKRRLRTPADVAAVVRDDVRRLDCETFWVLLLDAKNGMIGHPVVVSKGLLDASLVHPREVFKEAIKRGAAAVLLAHNHPSGDPSPSAEDVRITRQLVDAGRIIDIRVLDHVVLGRLRADGRPDYVSLRESGIVQFAE